MKSNNKNSEVKKGINNNIGKPDLKYIVVGKTLSESSVTCETETLEEAEAARADMMRTDVYSYIVIMTLPGYVRLYVMRSVNAELRHGSLLDDGMSAKDILDRALADSQLAKYVRHLSDDDMLDLMAYVQQTIVQTYEEEMMEEMAKLQESKMNLEKTRRSVFGDMDDIVEKLDKLSVRKK